MARKQFRLGAAMVLLALWGAAGPSFPSDLGTEASPLQVQATAKVRDGARAVPAPAPLPAGFRRIDSFKIDRSLTYDWDRYDIYLASWHNGVQTTGDPSLLTWNPDGSVTLEFRGDGQSGRSGMLKLVRPTKAEGRWGAVVDVTKPDAVAAFFLYAKNGKEIDFELTRRDGVLGWSPNVWMPKRGGGKASRHGAPLHIPFSSGPQVLEIELDAHAAVFLVDGIERARIEPDDMPPDCIWDVVTPVDLVLSVESHGPWAGQSYSDHRASMTAYALRP